MTRAQSVTCTGATTAIFDHLPQAASRESFRARAPGATLEGVTAETRTLAETLEPERKKWEDRGLELDREQVVLDAAARQAKNLEQLTQGFTDVAVARITNELTRPRQDTRPWSAAFFDSATAVRLRAMKETRDVAEKQRVLQQKLAEVEAELSPGVETGSYYVKSFRVQGELPEHLAPLKRGDVVRLCFKPPQVG